MTRTGAAPFERILAGTDGSDTARLAIAHAAHLARSLGAELTVLCAHRPAGADPRAPGGVTAEIARALLRDVEKEYRDTVSVKTTAVAGSAADALVEASAGGRFDLVVVGNRGMSRWTRAPQRSVPDLVSHRSRAAVLIVDTARGREPGYGRILVGVDGSRTAVRAVEVADALARACGGELTIATAAGSEPVGQSVLAPLRARWPGSPTLVLRGAPSDALCKLAESGGYDLLVVGNKGMAGPRRFLGSVPDRVSHRTPTSVLIVNTS